jgi:copper transport protein
LAAIDAWGQLVSTAYGRAVLVKLLLFFALVGFGAVNRRRTLPALRRAAEEHRLPGDAGQALLRLLRAELVIGLAVLGVTGALSTYAPANAVAAGPYSTSAPIGPARAELTVDPARPGADAVHLYLFDRKTGAQYDTVKEMTATISLPAKGVWELPVELRKAGPGHYVSSGASFPIAGSWVIVITARVSAFDEYTANLDVPIR